MFIWNIDKDILLRPWNWVTAGRYLKPASQEFREDLLLSEVSQRPGTLTSQKLKPKCQAVELKRTDEAGANKDEHVLLMMQILLRTASNDHRTLG